VAATDKLRSLHQALVDRVLGDDGQIAPDQRHRAFNNTGVPEQLQSLVEKVACRSSQVTDRDLDAARTAGFSDEQIFELIICAAVGAATRQYQSGLAALDGLADHQGSR
jgi:alkylhydroperoxidase family enzyme